MKEYCGHNEYRAIEPEAFWEKKYFIESYHFLSWVSFDRVDLPVL
jgi:hypothetical protein